MKYALFNGLRREAEHGLKGECQFDGHLMVPRCGDIRRPHWAHQVGHSCDPWWENEGEWHRSWKGHFPVDWQEVIHRAENGDKHIADVKTDQGWVFEFQHSFLNPEERQSRDAFYQKLIWIVDGTRRKKDLSQFSNAWEAGIPVNGKPFVRRIHANDCAILREWADTTAPVFIDFRPQLNLVWLLPKDFDGTRQYVAIFPRTELIAMHRGGVTQQVDDFAAFLKEFSQLISDYNAHLRAQLPAQPVPRPQYRQSYPTPSFNQFSARLARSRRRF